MSRQIIGRDTHNRFIESITGMFNRRIRNGLIEIEHLFVNACLLKHHDYNYQKLLKAQQYEWQAYGGRPLWFAATPSSLLSRELALSIPIQLDYEIENQTDEGNWQPNWSWGQYDDDWSVAKVEWAGYLTLRNLLILKAWDRL